MSGVSPFVRGHSGGSSRLSAAAEEFIKSDKALTRTTRSALSKRALEIDSNDERESSPLAFDFTSSPAAMTATGRDIKAAETNDHTRRSRKRKLNEYISIKLRQ
jgi:hypothetical protein